MPLLSRLSAACRLLLTNNGQPVNSNRQTPWSGDPVAPLEALSKTTAPSLRRTAQKSAAPIVRSLVSADVTFRGNMHVKNGIKIEGTVDGNVEVETGVLWVEQGGFVSGDIMAETAFINGRVDGKVCCKQILVGPSGRISGSVEYIDMHWQQGAVILGQLAQSREHPPVAADAVILAEPERTSGNTAVTAATRASRLAVV